MEAGWFAHVTVKPDAVIFVKFVICFGAAVGVVVVPEEVFVVVDVVVVGVVVPDEVLVVGVVVPDEVFVVVVDVLVGGGVVVAGLIVRVTGRETLSPLERLINTVVV